MLRGLRPSIYVLNGNLIVAGLTTCGPSTNNVSLSFHMRHLGRGKSYFDEIMPLSLALARGLEPIPNLPEDERFSTLLWGKRFIRKEDGWLAELFDVVLILDENIFVQMVGIRVQGLDNVPVMEFFEKYEPVSP